MKTRVQYDSISGVQHLFYIIGNQAAPGISLVIELREYSDLHIEIYAPQRRMKVSDQTFINSSTPRKAGNSGPVAIDVSSTIKVTHFTAHAKTWLSGLVSPISCVNFTISRLLLVHLSLTAQSILGF
ncbi:hypothetical protein GJ744_004408 [Endocarpon pusillum]|uniref:Uncharacterized protein n=1 Tax=Endocarpon pusillum TaxID=364733 RepID=A0A8H7ARW1_9EURO|nr:hypothetical protein GJ744_004408 [Endocarpon pusillum]